MRTYYLNVLGLPEGSSDEAIRKAYRRLAKLYHPDVSAHPDAQKKFVAINEAYEYLTSPQPAPSYSSPRSRPQPPFSQAKTNARRTQRAGPRPVEEKFTAEEYSRMSFKEFRQTAYFKNTKKQLINGLLSGPGFFTLLVWGSLVKLFFSVGQPLLGILFCLLPFAFIAWVLLSRPKR